MNNGFEVGPVVALSGAPLRQILAIRQNTTVHFTKYPVKQEQSMIWYGIQVWKSGCIYRWETRLHATAAL